MVRMGASHDRRMDTGDRRAATGKHTRPPGLDGVRRACLAALVALVIQYGIGIFLNLYVTIPAADQHAGMMQEITTAPFALTVHAVLGLALIGTALVLVARAVKLADRLLAGLAMIALAGIGGAFAAGEIFVRDGGKAGASFAMAILTAVAFLCYLASLALASMPGRYASRVPSAEHPPEPPRQFQYPHQLQYPQEPRNSRYLPPPSWPADPRLSGRAPAPPLPRRPPGHTGPLPRHTGPLPRLAAPWDRSDAGY
jgi:hypothetical protein